MAGMSRCFPWAAGRLFLGWGVHYDRRSIVERERDLGFCCRDPCFGSFTPKSGHVKLPNEGSLPGPAPSAQPTRSPHRHPTKCDLTLGRQYHIAFRVAGWWQQVDSATRALRALISEMGKSRSNMSVTFS